MMESVGISDHNLPFKQLGNQLGELVAVTADPEVLGYPYRHAWTSADQAKRYCESLTVLMQHIYLLLFAHIMKNKSCVLHVPTFFPQLFCYLGKLEMDCF